MHPNSKFVQFCKLFGLAPFSKNSKTQRLLAIYSYLLAFALTLLNIYGLNFNSFGDGYALSTIVSTIVNISQILAHVVVLLESLHTRDSQFEFFVKIHEFDELFRLRLLHKIQLKEMKKQLFRKYSIISVVILLNLSVFMYSIITYLPYFYAVASIVTARIRYIQAEIYLELINARFEVLHLKLKQIADCKENKKTRFLDVDYKAIEHPSRIITLKAAYGKLHQAVEYFNESFGWSMLFLISSYFLEVTCTSYWLLLAMNGGLPEYMLWDCTTTIIPLGLQLASLCSTCNTCTDNGSRTKELTQRIFGSLKDDNKSDLLDEFLLQTSLRPILIHAKHFFCINLELLGAILSSIISSLVILIQFLVIENKEV